MLHSATGRAGWTILLYFAQCRDVEDLYRSLCASLLFMRPCSLPLSLWLRRKRGGERLGGAGRRARPKMSRGEQL